MKPIAQGCTAVAQDGKCSPVVWFGPYPKDGERVYTESEIRKWLSEEPSEEMIRAVMQAYLDARRGSGSEFTAMCRAMIAAKLQELK